MLGLKLDHVSKRGHCCLSFAPGFGGPGSLLLFGHVARYGNPYLTHWDRVTHICVGKLTIIDSDNGLSPDRRQAIICTNAGILVIGPLGTNFSEIWIEIHAFSLRKIYLKMSSGKWRPFCLGRCTIPVPPTWGPTYEGPPQTRGPPGSDDWRERPLRRTCRAPAPWQGGLAGMPCNDLRGHHWSTSCWDRTRTWVWSAWIAHLAKMDHKMSKCEIITNTICHTSNFISKKDYCTNPYVQWNKKTHILTHSPLANLNTSRLFY